MARCSECGTPLEVGERQARRKRDGGLCTYCRARPQITPRDVDFRFWATRFGVQVPPGKSAQEVLASGNLPDELAQIIDGFKQPAR